MPVVQVWGLPSELTEEQLQQIHRSIVAEAVSMTEFLIKGEKDMTVLFPPDMMAYGLGSEVVIEVVTGMFMRLQLGDWYRQKFARGMVRAVKRVLPEPMVECFIPRFRREDGFYNSPAGEQVPDEK